MKKTALIVSIFAMLTINAYADCTVCSQSLGSVLSNLVLTTAAAADCAVSESLPRGLNSRVCAFLNAGEHKKALRLIVRIHKLQFEDIYHLISCEHGAIFKTLVAKMKLKYHDSAEYLLKYIKYREKKTGKKFLNGILNKLDSNSKTLLDGLYSMKDSADTDAAKERIQKFIDLYKEYGAKKGSEIK